MKKNPVKEAGNVTGKTKETSDIDHVKPCSGDDCTTVIPCCWFDVPCCQGLKAGQHCRSDTTQTTD